MLLLRLGAPTLRHHSCGSSQLSFSHRPNINFIIHQSSTTTAMIIPASLNIATLFPLWAMRPSRCADPLMLPLRFEKTSFYHERISLSRGKHTEKSTDAVINHLLTPGIVVDVDGHAAQSGDFGGEFVEGGVVLS